MVYDSHSAIFERASYYRSRALQNNTFTGTYTFVTTISDAAVDGPYDNTRSIFDCFYLIITRVRLIAIFRECNHHPTIVINSNCFDMSKVISVLYLC